MRGLLVSQRGRWRELSWWGRVVGERRGRRAAAGAALLRVLLGRAERESWLGARVRGCWAREGGGRVLGPLGWRRGENGLRGGERGVRVGPDWFGLLGWFGSSNSFPLIYSISKQLKSI